MPNAINGTLKDVSGNALNPSSVGEQIALTAQNGVTQTDVQKEFEALHAKVDGIEGNADAMQYKGVINADGELPATYEPGWTWKVGTEGVYKGHACQTGDLLIANTSRAGAENADSDFDVVQGNVDRPVSGPDSSASENIVLFDGEDGMKIKDSGIAASDMKDAVKKSFAVIEHGAPIPSGELRADALVFEKI